VSYYEILNWLLEGDVAIKYQTHRDLLGNDQLVLKNLIETQGWGEQYLSKRKSDGYWGEDFYQPKWISTHYTLLDLKNLNISPENSKIKETLTIIFNTEKGPDGGILPIGLDKKSDVCVNGMVLNYASYFGIDEEQLKSLIDFILHEKMDDGGFNCLSNRKIVTHSSMHSTISVLEGILEYQRNGYKYRLSELLEAKARSEEFLLFHKLFRSHKTGDIIKPNFLKLYYPTRWYYDILRAMDYFYSAKVPFDARMNETIDVILKKRNKDGQWKLAAHHPGQQHFEMEQAGKPSRWNTLRALRVLKFYKVL
jgi:hypothetical protein